MKKGFWSWLEEMSPKLPDKGFVDWTASLDALREYLRSQGLKCNNALIEAALASAAEWNPGFPWKVERLPDNRFRFTRRR